MLPTKFVENVGSKLAERWVATLLTPTFCFWAGGFIAWGQNYGWSRLTTKITALNLSQAQQIALVVGGLLLVAISAIASQRCDLFILRLLEGYWPRWLNRPRKWLSNRKRSQLERTKARWQHLMQQERALSSTSGADLSDLSDAIAELGQLELKMRWLPSDLKYVMPTRLGNILRAAELRPKTKYGLDAVVCWPHLWLLLPEQARGDLQEARASLNASARIWLWGILFVGWTPLAVWALPAGLAVAMLAYRSCLSVAQTYGNLIEAAFDLYRNDLYRALRWPLPENPEAEQKSGMLLSEFLWRGPVRPIPTYRAE